MVKVLRKYNKILLVGFGVVLMITFLLPQQGGPKDMSGRTIAQVGGNNVTVGQLEKADLEYAVLEMMMPAVLKVLLEVENGTHWFLLTHEAERGGFVGETRDGPEWFPELAASIADLAQQMGQVRFFSAQQQAEFIQRQTAALEEARNRFSHSTRLTPDEVDHAISKARGVMRMMNFYQSAGKLSDRRFVQVASANLDSVFVDFAFIPGDNLDDPAATPGEDQIKAQYEKYRDVQPGTGEFGFGYRQPPRVKFEYLTLDRKAIGDAFSPDLVDVNKRWRTSRDRFPGLFVAEQKKVEDELREEKVRAIFADAGQIVRAEVLRITRDLPTDGKYYRLPAAEEWEKARPSFDRIAQAVVDAVKSKHNVTIPKPVVTTHADSWMTGNDIQFLPGFGQASIQLGSNEIPASMAALAVKELGETSDLGFQVGVPVVDNAPSDRLGNRYYFTVLAVRPAGPPESLDEVRSKVVQDVESMQGYEALVAKAEEVKAAAISSGLEEAVKPFAKAGKDAEGKPLPAVPPRVVKYQAIPRDSESRDWPKEFRDAAWKAAEGLDPTVAPDPASKDPARFFTAAIPGFRGLVVGHVITVRPMTRELARRAVDPQSSGAAAEELISAKGVREHSPFRLVSMQERLNFRMLGKEMPDTTTKKSDKPQDPSEPLKGS